MGTSGEIMDRPRRTNGTIRWTDTEHTRAHFDGDPQALASDLRRAVRGEVLFDGAARSLYATDASNYRQVPVGVVVPRDADDLVEAIRVCRGHGAPITNRGGGTGLAGGATNAAVVIDCSKYMNRILELDPERRIARVEPGVVLDRLRDEAEKHNLTYGPDPSTHEYCTLGGMIGNNSCGVHSQMSGRTEDNVHELEIVTYRGDRLRVGRTEDGQLDAIIARGGAQGEIYRKLRDLRDRYAGLIRERYPNIPRRVSGYSLPELLPENGFHVARALVGTEGTCATILEATVRLVPSPQHRVLLVVGFASIYEAGDEVAGVAALGPTGLEGMDQELVSYMMFKNVHERSLRLLPEGKGWLMIEFGADSDEEARAQAERCVDHLKKSQRGRETEMRLITDPHHMKALYEVRESGLAATAHGTNMYEDSWPGWEDSAVPPERIGDYLREIRALFTKYGYEASVYGHFGHGIVHTSINFDLQSADGIKKYRAFVDEASDVCLRFGGSLSGEHGDGQSRAELLPKMFGADLVQAFREFKEAWDPDWKMNPGKVVDPYRMDENLRLGVTYDPPRLDTHFAYPDDQYSFAHAALRCVGAGKCRRLDVPAEDVMCPSYLATKNEMHTTRGRARLLFEMLNGDETPDAWRNDDVKEALDLCLACKGCKGDCPVNVDMATYKAEFLAHYYEGRLRPRSAYSMGLIYWWARIAAHVPGLVNYLTHAPGVSDLVKRIGGIHPDRKIPEFAPETFKDWFSKRGIRNAGKPRVIVWADTFNNHFHPEVAQAAVEVIEAAGFEVDVPRASLCCGRPLYDYGWLGLAKSMWAEILEALRDDIRAGTPIVGLEPSCVAAFRDELGNLFPHDEDARRLQKQVFTLAEFLEQKASHLELPKLEGKALVHGHCHQKSIMGLDADRSVLEKMGLDFELAKSSCCGVAGSFGYEHDHFDLSMQCGELALLPAVRDAGKETLILADGFSCRSQIEQGTDRRALHLAQALQMAMRGQGEGNGARGAYPERRYTGAMQRNLNAGARHLNGRHRPLKIAGAVLGGIALGWALRRL